MISRESAAVFIRILVAGSTHTDSARRLRGPLWLFFFSSRHFCVTDSRSGEPVVYNQDFTPAARRAVMMVERERKRNNIPLGRGECLGKTAITRETE
jgi:hypothetical protein